MKDGYVFVNEDGRYAQEIRNAGFGSAPTCIAWTDSLNDASVFNSEKPWSNGVSKHLYSALGQQAKSLKVTRTTIVKLKLGE